MADNTNSDGGYFRDNAGLAYQTADSKPATTPTTVTLPGGGTGTLSGGVVTPHK